MGLTLYCRNTLERQPVAEFITILGGPLASYLGLLIGLAAWWSGLHSDVLLSWIAISALLCLTSSIPSVIGQGRVRLENDARLLWGILQYRRQTRNASAGCEPEQHARA